mgnify:CR=1 FL=1
MKYEVLAVLSLIFGVIPIFLLIFIDDLSYDIVAGRADGFILYGVSSIAVVFGAIGIIKNEGRYRNISLFGLFAAIFVILILLSLPGGVIID